MTVLFFVTILFDEMRSKMLCIHTKLIIVCRRLRALKKRAIVRSLHVFVGFASGARTVKMFYFARL